MWRKNASTENQDSDQSISEEDDMDGEWSEHCVSLGGATHTENKERVQVLSQLQILRDAHELDYAAKTSDISDMGQTEDDVEFPIFINKDGPDHFTRIPSVPDSDEEIIHFPTLAPLGNSDEEVISDEEKFNLRTFGSAKKDSHRMWSEAREEAKTLILLNENSGCSSSYGVLPKSFKSSKVVAGGSRKAKPKLLFRFQSNKEGSPLVVNENIKADSIWDVLPLPKESNTTENSERGSYSELVEVFQRKEVEQPKKRGSPCEVAVRHDHGGDLITEFQECFPKNSGGLQDNVKVRGRTRLRRADVVDKRNMSVLGDRRLDEDDLLEALDSGPSSGDENNLQDRNHVIPESKSRTIADQFQEALGALPMRDEITGAAFHRQYGPGTGLFKKLQLIMQSEKEAEMNFNKKMQMEAFLNDEVSSIGVRILSKSLEAKLTVCSCILAADEERNELVNDFEMRKKVEGRALTVIFSSKTCNDVELEVGSLIHIHPPWKEVAAKGKDKVIILATFFSGGHCL